MEDCINTEVDLSLSAKVKDVKYELTKSTLKQIELLSLENMRLRERIERLEDEIRKGSCCGARD